MPDSYATPSPASRITRLDVSRAESAHEVSAIHWECARLFDVAVRRGRALLKRSAPIASLLFPRLHEPDFSFVREVESGVRESLHQQIVRAVHHLENQLESVWRRQGLGMEPRSISISRFADERAELGLLLGAAVDAKLRGQDWETAVRAVFEEASIAQRVGIALTLVALMLAGQAIWLSPALAPWCGALGMVGAAVAGYCAWQKRERALAVFEKLLIEQREDLLGALDGCLSAAVDRFYRDVDTQLL